MGVPNDDRGEGCDGDSKHPDGRQGVDTFSIF